MCSVIDTRVRSQLIPVGYGGVFEPGSALEDQGDRAARVGAAPRHQLTRRVAGRVGERQAVDHLLDRHRIGEAGRAQDAVTDGLAWGQLDVRPGRRDGERVYHQV